MIKINFFKSEKGSLGSFPFFMVFIVFFLLLSLVLNKNETVTISTKETSNPVLPKVVKNSYIINSEKKLSVAIKDPSFLIEVTDAPRPEVYRVIVSIAMCKSGQAVINEDGSRNYEKCGRQEVYSTLVSGKASEITDAQVKKIIEEIRYQK